MISGNWNHFYQTTQINYWQEIDKEDSCKFILQIFDPLELICPVLNEAKCLILELFTKKYQLGYSFETRYREETFEIPGQNCETNSISTDSSYQQIAKGMIV